MKSNSSYSNQSKKYLIIYTLVFAVFSLCIFMPFLLSDALLISSKDCVKQHYPAFVYLGQYIRQIVRGLFENGTLTIPAWDWNLGYGADILTTLNYYSIGDPLNLISVFVPTKYSVYGFEAVIILRLYLAGLSFSWFCWNKQKNKFAVLIGAVIYIFSAYGLHTSTIHVFFANVMIYLPIFLLAVEKLIYEKKKGLFIAITTLSCVSNFYFFYMLSIMAGVYFLICFCKKYLKNNKEGRFSQFVKEGCRFFASYLQGLGCAAIIFLPVLIAFKNNGRSSGGELNLLTYSSNEYIGLLTGSFGHLENKLSGGFAALVLLIIIFMIVRAKKYKSELMGMGILILMEFLPAVGWVLNGFTYVTDRWVFVTNFYVAYLVVKILPDIYCIVNKKIIVKVLPMLAIYICGAYALRSAFALQTKDIIYTGISAALIIGVLYLLANKKRSNLKPILLGIVLINTSCISGLYFNNLIEKNFFASVDYIEKSLKNSSISNDYKIKVGEKIDVLSPNIMNYSIFNGYGSTSTYWSMGDKGISEYQNCLLNQKMAITNAISGYDSRTVLNALNAVKYIVVRDPYYEKIPYGYKLIESNYNEETGLEEKIYKNKFSLTPAYGYTKYMTKEEWLKLSPIEKEESMLDTVILEDDISLTENTEQVSVQQYIQTGNEFISAIKEANRGNENVVITDNSITVKENRTVVKIPVKAYPKTENYVYFKNFSYEPLGDEEPVSETPMVFWYAGTASYLNFANQYSRYHPDRDDFFANIGYTDMKDEELIIDFRVRGTYKFDVLEFISKDMSNYKEKVTALAENSADSIKVKGNNVFLKKNSIQKELLYINIPYSSGWKAYVNGEETEIKRANIMGMGLLLPEGENDIVFEYSTPGFKAGALISAITMLLIAISYFIKKRNARNIVGGENAKES